MIRLIQDKYEELARLCLKYKVKSLEVFGSAASDNFDPASSDLDFLVQFEQCSPSDHYERYFGLLESLQTLFGQSIDLVETNAMKNPYFIRRVNQTRTPIYAA
jgi:predicted nucleotidyltransferase